MGGDGASGMHARGCMHGGLTVSPTEGLLVLKTGAGGAHLKHAVHACDLGCIKFHGLVERHRMLPGRNEKRAYDAGRGARAWRRERRRATAAQAACTGGLDCRFGVGHREERTENMVYMVVTLDVSKLSGWLNADA